MRFILRLLAVLLVAVAGAAGWMTWRATRLVPRRVTAPPADPSITSAATSAARLAEAVRFRTISSQDTATWDSLPFVEFRDWLVAAYPRVHATLTRELVNRHSLLYTWKGSDTTLAPLLLTGHFDVVPVEPGTESRWTHQPFAGDTAGGFVWGRGALDDKVSVIGVLEGAELLLTQGFTPTRTILFAFGHDEELGGGQGAGHMAPLIRERYGSVSMLVDEGGFVSRGLVPGVERPVALIAVAEKSSMTVELSVIGAGGHSSVPPNHSALGILARALARLEDAQMPARLTPVTTAFLRNIAAEGDFTMRLALANPVLEPMVVRQLLSRPQTASTVRTSTAVTMASGSPKENVLPIRAVGMVNFRILPGDSVQGVLEHVRRAVNDTSVHIRALGTPREPSPIADFQSKEFGILERTIVQLYDSVLATPYLLTAATDTRHYESLTRNVFRFAPAVVTSEMISGAHGTDERVRTADFAHGIRFWAQFMKNAQER
ncbi:MAG: M20 family peptidase [Gemmatimonadaceae bacterium]